MSKRIRTLPGRSLLRPVKRAVMRPRLMRVLRRRKWEHKWRTRPGFAWQVDGVAAELESAVDDGWLRPGMSVLDLGCGDGVNAAWLADRGFTVHGIDFSEAAVERARLRNASTPGVTFEAADVSDRRALAERRFDALVDRGCLHCIPDQLRPAYAANVAAWASPGAPFLLTMIGWQHAMEERRQTASGLLGRWFEIESMSRAPAVARTATREIDGIVLRLRRNEA